MHDMVIYLQPIFFVKVLCFKYQIRFLVMEVIFLVAQSWTLLCTEIISCCKVKQRDFE